MDSRGIIWEDYGCLPNWLKFFLISSFKCMENIPDRSKLYYNSLRPIPAAERSKAWLFGLSLAGIGGLNPAGSMNVCLL